MSGSTNTNGLPINSSNPLTTLNGGIGRSVTPTSGSILFYDSTGVQQNNSSFFWNNTNSQLGIGTNSFDFSGVNFQISNNSVLGVSAVIRSSLTGSANQAALYVCRGDQTNGNSLVRFVTGVAGASTPDWDLGTVNSGISTPTNFIFSNSGGTRLSLSSAGVLNLPSLTASQAVVTDSSKNLGSLAYTNTNTASTLVQRDGSGNFSAGTITASLTGTATTATNATNVATTQVSTNASYFPLMAASSTNSNQAADLATGLTYNPSTNILNTTGLSLSGLTQGSILFTGSSGAISQNNGNFFWDNTNDNLYIGANTSTTLDVPGRIVVRGTASSVSNGADVIFYDTADSHPLMQILPFLHDNVGISFDAAYNGTNWVSSYSSSQFQIYKLASKLQFNYASATLGSTFSWTSGPSIDTNGIFSASQINLAIGKTLLLTTGTNACRGTASMSTGSASVSTTAVGTGNMIIVTGPGANSYGTTITNGVGFSITSSNVLDATTVNWVIIK